MTYRNGAFRPTTSPAVDGRPSSNDKPPKVLVEISAGAVQVDATLIAEGLATEPLLLMQRMREGLITSLCERGTAQDQGRYRLTFFSRDRRFQLVVNEQGAVLQRFELHVGASRTACAPGDPRGANEPPVIHCGD